MTASLTQFDIDRHFCQCIVTLTLIGRHIDTDILFVSPAKHSGT